MSEEQPETQDPPGEGEAEEGEAGEGEAGESEAGEGEAGESEAAEVQEAEGEVGVDEGENETDTTTGDETLDANMQEVPEQEPAGGAESSPVEYTENEAQTDFTFSPTASNTDIARQLLETLEAEGAAEEPTETQDLDQEKEVEEDADKEATEGEEQEGGADTEVTEEAADTEAEQAGSEQQEETEIDDWIKERKGKKPKESRAMWDYSLYAPISMVQDQIVETYEDLVLPIFTKLCEPMWDYDLLASPSMLESQVDETYELKLQLSSLKCEPMWDYQLSVPPEMAEAQVYFEEKELRFEVSSLKCHPMWDYDLSAPIQKAPEEIYWVPSYLNFVGVTREKFFHIEETPNTKFIQTDLHFDPDIIIKPEDLLREPDEEYEEKRRCYTDAKHVSEEIADIGDESDETWYPDYLNTGEMKKPYKLIGDRCVIEEADLEIATDEALEARGSENEELADDEVTSAEVQTDVGLGELLQSESISSVPDAADLQGELTSTPDVLNESEDQPLVVDSWALDIPEESAPIESEIEVSGGDETVQKGEPDVPWALLSDTAVAPQPFLIPQEDDILSTVSLAPTAERQENKFNFAITLGESVWGFPEYSTEEEIASSTVLPQNGEEFTWVPDSTTPFESSVFAPISEEDALLLESVHVDEPLQRTDSGSFKVIDVLETEDLSKEMSNENETENETENEIENETVFAQEQREHSPSRGPIIEVEITMIPSASGQHSSETAPQIEVGVAWEALPESLADGRTPDIIVTTVLEDSKK
ncbi:uncharacterized protein LOC126458987 isoform X2 [Schistocerca serialis cubense]|nr:uncharacterized protein LOC126458987 isoform X2 [Schistocerca serialis cubense]